MKNLKIILPIVGLALLCSIAAFLFLNKEKEVVEVVEEAFINPPIPSLVAEFQEKKFNAEKGITWNFPNSTRIKIPANALMDKDSNAIKGEIVLKFRDYHNAVDVFLSGIPMGYKDSTGLSGNMQTAGMFELRAEINGAEVFLKEGKEAKVELASEVSSKGYNSYYLNEKERAWNYLEPNSAKRNNRKINQKKVVEELRPGIPFPLSRKYFALDYNVLMDVYFKDKRKDFNDDILKQQLEAYGLDWVNSESLDGVVYNGKKKPAALMIWKKVSNNNIPAWAENGTSHFLPIGGNQYNMRIKSKDQKDSTDITVELVMPIGYLFKLPAEEWTNDYKTAFSKFRKEEKRMAMMSDFTRNLNVSNFGVYNYDVIMKEDEALMLAASFDFKTTFDENISQPDVYYIPGTGRAVVKYPQYQWNKFPLMPDKKGMLFSLLPGNKLAIYAKKEYADIPFKELKKAEQANYQFEMATVIENIQSAKDLEKVLLN